MDISFFEKKPNLNNLNFKNKYVQNLVNFNVEDMPNLLFFGHKGCGKTTKIYAFLNTILNDKVYNLKNVEIELDKKIFKYRSSIYHIEIDSLELLNNERFFFQNFLKEYVSTRNIGLDMPKIIILLNAHKINKNSLLMLRKIIETNYISSKYIFETSNINFLPETLLTRFLSLRISSPKREEIEDLFTNIIKKNKIKFGKKILNSIIDVDKNYSLFYNLNNIFCAFNYYIKTNELFINNYHKLINEIIVIIINKKTNFEIIYILKSICEKIFINCYDVHELIFNINYILTNKYNNDLKLCTNIIKLTSECDMNLLKSTGKYFIHLENYFIKLILLIQK